MSNDDDLFHLSEPILKHMGLVIAYWGVLEAQIEFFILRNQKIPSSTGLLLTTNLSYRAKADLLMTFAKSDRDLPESEKTALKDIVVEADRLYGKRNRVTHSSWHPTADPLVARVRGIRARGKLVITDKDIHIDKLRQDAVDIRELGRVMLDFMKRNGIRPEDGY